MPDLSAALRSLLRLVRRLLSALAPRPEPIALPVRAAGRRGHRASPGTAPRR